MDIQLAISTRPQLKSSGSSQGIIPLFLMSLVACETTSSQDATGSTAPVPAITSIPSTHTSGELLTTEEIEARRPVIAGCIVSHVVPTERYRGSFVAVRSEFSLDPAAPPASIETPSYDYYYAAMSGELRFEGLLKLGRRIAPVPAPAPVLVSEWSRLQDDLARSFFSGRHPSESATKIQRYQVRLPLVFSHLELDALAPLTRDWFDWLRKGSGPPSPAW